MQKKDPSNEHDFGRANIWKKARTKKKKKGGYMNEDVKNVANQIVRFSMLHVHQNHMNIYILHITNQILLLLG